MDEVLPCVAYVTTAGSETTRIMRTTYNNTSTNLGISKALGNVGALILTALRSTMVMVQRRIRSAGATKIQF